MIPAAAGPEAPEGMIPAATRPMTALVAAPRSSRASARMRDGAARLPSARVLAAMVAAAAASRPGGVPTRPRASAMPAAPPSSAPGADGCHVASRATTSTSRPLARDRISTSRRWAVPASAPPPMPSGASGLTKLAATSVTTTAPRPASVPRRRKPRKSVAITAPPMAAARKASTLIDGRRLPSWRLPDDREAHPGRRSRRSPPRRRRSGPSPPPRASRGRFPRPSR